MHKILFDAIVENTHPLWGWVFSSYKCTIQNLHFVFFLDVGKEVRDMRNKILGSSRGARRVFAKKSRASYNDLRKQFLLRGGGYL